jgi:hypothetical protein
MPLGHADLGLGDRDLVSRREVARLWSTPVSEPTVFVDEEIAAMTAAVDPTVPGPRGRVPRNRAELLGQ